MYVGTSMLDKKEYDRLWRINHKEEIKIRNRDYYLTHLKERKIYLELNKEKIKKYTKTSKYYYERYNKNLNYRLRCLLKGRLSDALKNNRKASSIINLLGSSIADFRIYIESKFDSTMSWNNYGYYGWHIDHVIPCAHFDLSKEEDQYRCFHYTNLQPLWAKDNLSKGSRVS